MNNEVFKPIDGCKNCLVSDKGRVYNSKTKRYIGTQDENGYIKVSLLIHTKIKTLYVHRLVCELFNDNPFNKTDVNHINGNKSDNRKDNLAWNTKSENMVHAYGTGLANAKPPKGEKHNMAKLSDSQVKEIRELIKTGVKQIQLAKTFDISVSQIGRIARHESRMI